MPKLTLSPLDQSVSFEPGESLLDILRRAGVEVDSPCGGRGTCGKCRVRVQTSGIPETFHRGISEAESVHGIRLACQVASGLDLRVLLEDNYALDGQVLEGRELSAARLAPAARVVRRGRGWQMEYGGSLTQPLESWDRKYRPKGLSIDLGTTTLVVSLFDLRTGKHLGSSSGVNPQVAFGHDVLTRVHRGSTPTGLAELAASVRGGLNQLIETACSSSSSVAGEIVDVVIGANPAMLQLAARMDPRPLGQAPFTATIEGGISYPAETFGLAVNPAARVYVPPIAHAFVGSDISAGLLAAEFFRKEETVLFLDLGTNGELALAHEGRRWVTSAAAGPAFEGMGITKGMRAARGAVEAVRIAEDGLGVDVDVIGGGEATGICGSGLLDLVACLVKMGALDRSGRMAPPPSGPTNRPGAPGLVEREGGPAFLVAPGIPFTQMDVRQFQLGKGAVRTAIELLLDAAAVTANSLDEVILAGAFGRHVRPASLEAVGLLPAGTASRVSFAGNTSATGCALLLLDADLRRELEVQMSQVEHLPLPEQRAFQKHFLKALAFPD